MKVVQKLSCPAVHEGLWRDCGLFLVYEQPFSRKAGEGLCSSHTSRVVLHPIASLRMPLPLHLVSPVAGALAPSFPFLPCNHLSPFCNLGLGCLVCGSWVLTHPRCPVLSFRWVDTHDLTGAHRQLQSCFCRTPLQPLWGCGRHWGPIQLRSQPLLSLLFGVLWSLVFSLPYLSLHLD